MNWKRRIEKISTGGAAMMRRVGDITDGRVNVLLSCIGKGIAGFLLSRVSLFGVCSPLGSGFTAACGGGFGGAFAAVGSMLGAVSIGAKAGLRYAAVTLLVYAAAFLFRDIYISRKAWFMPLMCSIMSLCVGMVYLLYDGLGIDFRRIVAFCAELMLSAGSCCLYRELMNDEKERGNEQSAMSLLAFTVSIALALSSIVPFGVLSLGRLAAMFGSLVGAFVSGAAGGGMCGLVLGMAIDAAGQTPGLCTLCIGLGAAFGGIYKRKGRLVTALCFVAANAAAAFWAAPPDVRNQLLFEGFAASVLFMLPPDRLLSNIGLSDSRSAKGAASELRYLSERSNAAAATLRDIGFRLQNTKTAGKNDEDIWTVFDVSAETVCRGCEEKERCWGREYERTRSAMTEAAEKMNSRGSMETEDLPLWFRDGCVKVREFSETVNHELRALFLRRQMKNRLKANRELLYCQYIEFSEVLKGVAGSVVLPGREERSMERRLDGFLQELAPGSESAVFRDRNRRLHIDIQGSGVTLLTMEKNWLERISGLLELELSCPDTEGKVLHLYEAEPLEAEIGIAATGKGGKEPSGDIAKFFKTTEGILYLIVADGMGSGREAAEEGTAAASMAEKLLLSGVQPAAVLKLLNTSMLLRSEKRMSCASIDLMSVNLFTGETLIFKYGAAPTYVRSGGLVRAVCGNTQAAGTGLGEPDCVRLSLGDGCAAVILSDGAARSGLIENRLLNRTDDMKAMAGEILADAAARVGWEDDMTVLAVSIKRVIPFAG